MSGIKKIRSAIDFRLGLSGTILRPVPRYSLSTGMWLGALAVVSFVILAVTGCLMLSSYVPTPDTAYSSTTGIITTVPFGSLVETVHLYAAYSMILFAFLHMMRGFFANVHKKPRELMWIVGVLMGLVTLMSGFTGYLLPWTVVSKSATDVSIGILNNLPNPLRSVLLHLLAGSGSSSDLLTHFFGLHIVVLPGVLVILLMIKMHMFEVHGVSKPLKPRQGFNSERIYEAMEVGGEDPGKMYETLPWFPTVAVYVLMISSVFVSLLLFLSAIFPIQLPAQYTPQAAAGYMPEPEWYFLWVYQILKISIFGGKGVLAAITFVSALPILLILLPLLDRSKRDSFTGRPLYASIGIAMSYEVLALTVWAAMTPGRTIGNLDALIVLVLPAFIIIASGFAWARRHRGVSN
jgi:quinol-cytochrome oxidoreductase complex cytochrome b subunit